MNHKILKTILPLILITISIQAQTINVVWNIKLGTGDDQIVGVDDLVYYDFEVYKGQLFVCDIVNSLVKRYDEKGQFKCSYSLVSPPEVICLYKDYLFVCMQNGQLAKIDIRNDANKKTDNITINEKIISTEGAFFKDNFLYIPLREQVFNLKSDGVLVNLDSLTKIEFIPELFDYIKKTKINDSEIEFKLSNLCGCSKNMLIVEKHFGEKGRSGSSQYVFFDNNSDKKGQTIIGLDEKQTGLILHTDVCRGFKIYPNAIYCIGMTFNEGAEDCLVITKIVL